jgi:hypothetical protein
VDRCGHNWFWLQFLARHGFILSRTTSKRGFIIP